MPNRHGQSDDYRYGFQGQENDDEIRGTKGASVNYKYRMHDARIGRFFAVDPLNPKYPYYTPYSFSGNRVIDAVEIEGLEERVIIYEAGKEKPTVIQISDFKGTNGEQKYKQAISAYACYASYVRNSTTNHKKVGLENYIVYKNGDGTSDLSLRGTLILDLRSEGGFIAFDNTDLGLKTKSLTARDHYEHNKRMAKLFWDAKPGTPVGDMKAAMGNYVMAVTSVIPITAAGKVVVGSVKIASGGLKLYSSVNKVMGAGYTAYGKVTAVIKNTSLLKKLNSASKGNWVKVYEAGVKNGKKIETHYFKNLNTGKVFDVKKKYDKWHQKSFKKIKID